MNPVGKVRDDGHVVLDQRDRQATHGDRLPDQSDDLLHHLGADAGRRLIQKQERELAREQAGQGQQLLLSERELPRQAARLILQADMLDPTRGRRLVLSKCLSGVAGSEPGAPGILGRMRHESHDDVFQYGQPAEDPYVLKLAANPQAGDPMASPAADVGPSETDDTLIRPQGAGNDVQQRGLARAVRTDEGRDLPRRHGDANAAKDPEIPKALADVVQYQAVHDETPEWWNGGMMEEWILGIVEWRNNGMMQGQR